MNWILRLTKTKMFINNILYKFQSSKLACFLKNSLIFENIDDISFILLIGVIISTTFLSSGYIGLFATLFAMSCLFKFLLNKGDKFEISTANKILIIYFLFVIISTLGASLFILSLKGILKTFIYAIFYFALAYFLSSNRKKILPIVLLIAGAVSFESIIAIIQNMGHVQEIATWQDTSSLSDPTRAISRAYGTLKPYNPNLLAGYLVAGFSSILSLGFIAYINKHKKMVLFFSILFLLSLWAIFITGCRGAYLGLFGFMLVITLFISNYVKKQYGGFKNIKKRYKALCASIVAFFTGIVLFIPSISSRILSIFSFRGDSSISFRMNVYQACYQMFLDNKFLGIGVGNKNFREIYGLYMMTGYDALGAYCVPLEIAVESGIFALLSFASFVGFVIFKCIKYIFDKKNILQNRAIIFSILLSITAVMFHGLFDTVFFRPQIQILFWTNIAIFHALTKENMQIQNK